jgi:outer membrane protein assembly factor BamB
VGRIAVADGLVVAATADAVVGLDPASGERAWRHAADHRVRPSSLAVTDDLVVYGTRRTLHGLGRTDGTERWALVFGVRGAAIVVGDTLYGVGRFDPTTARIMLSAVDVTSGRRRWRQQIYDPLVDVMAAQGYLFATTTDGRLFAFTHL